MSKSISVLIATRDRNEELAKTLQLLRVGTHIIDALIVIDDGSPTPVEAVVREIWPDAVVVRHNTSAGQCQRRSEGFLASRGDYILQLDDDSAPVNADTLERAVRILDENSHLALLAFHIYNGPELSDKMRAHGTARYTASFVGCGALIRRDAVLETGGYTSFFGNEWEEEELSLRLMKAGWGLWYDPSLIVHHRVSPRNRQSKRTWMRGFRNKLWSLFLHFPAHRVVVDGAWVVAVACWDAIRMQRLGFLLIGLWQFGKGLPHVIGLRRPMPKGFMVRYDALRFREIRTRKEFDSPPRVAVRDIWCWYTRVWRNRARQRSFWDRRGGDQGSSPTVVFEHESQME